jgi:hypothetical protein
MIKYRFAGLNPNSWMVKSKNVGGLKLNPYFGRYPPVFKRDNGESLVNGGL